MVDPVEGPLGPPPALFLDQNEAQRTQKNFYETAPPLPLISESRFLSEGLDPLLGTMGPSCLLR